MTKSNHNYFRDDCGSNTPISNGICIPASQMKIDEAAATISANIGIIDIIKVSSFFIYAISF